ncbi:MAG: TIGR01777 family oxidoreductase [Pseudomonadota bacterium]
MDSYFFTRRSSIDFPVEDVFRWHARPGAIERLSPPWDPLKVLMRSGGIEKGAEVLLRMKAGPFPFTWHARHTEFQENRYFRDEQVRGPFAKWVHTHRFIPHAENGCILEDEIEYRLPLHFLSGPLSRPMIEKKLERIFRYRHRITRNDLSRHLSGSTKKPMTILISGAGGVIGSALVPFLTTGGHRVVKLVRRQPDNSGNEVFWNPRTGELDLDGVGPIDAVIHLAGDNIGNGRWTEQKKKIIVESRTMGTALIAGKVAALDKPPEVVICASAIGYYGDRGDDILNEDHDPGNDFISMVCEQWEHSACLLPDQGIRTAFLRIGVALTPTGGALKRLLLPYKMGLGGRIGSGNQYISWVDMEDVIGAIHHVLMQDSVSGPVNIVSPNPVTSRTFTRTLGAILSRPTPFPIPEKVIQLTFGEMGNEILLSSTRVMPKKLLQTGYRFVHPILDEALKQMLGKA